MYMTGGDQPFIIDKDSEELVAENNCQITKINVSNDGNLLAYGDEEGSFYMEIKFF